MLKIASYLPNRRRISTSASGSSNSQNSAYLRESLLECAPRDLNPAPNVSNHRCVYAGTLYDEHQMRTLNSEKE